MLALFRTNQFIVNIFLLFYAGVLHLSALIWPDLSWDPPTHGILSGWIYEWVGSTGKLPELLAVLLVFVQAVMLNVFFADNRITGTYTLFPGLFYILVASLLPEFLHLSPILLANTFYLLAFKELFSIYRRPSAAGQIFNSGFWIGVASLFYFSFAIFLFWAFVGLNIMRAFRLKERFMVLTGLLIPYILTSVYYFYTDQWNTWIQEQFTANYSWLDLLPLASTLELVKLIFVGVLILLILLGYGRYSSRRTIDVQKKIDLMHWGLLFGGGTIFFQTGIKLDHASILAIPMGMILSIAFVQLSSRWAEAWHLLLVVIVLYFQYHHYFLLFSL